MEGLYSGTVNAPRTVDIAPEHREQAERTVAEMDREAEQAYARAATKMVGSGVVDSADDLFADAELPRESLYVARTGKTYLFRGLSAREVNAFQESLIKFRGTKHQKVSTELYNAGLFVRGAIKPNGDPLVQMEQLPRVAAMPGDIVGPGAEVVARLSGLTKEDQQALVDELGEDQTATS